MRIILQIIQEYQADVYWREFFMKLLAQKRERLGTSASKQARAANKVPAVIFGKEIESLPVLVDKKELEDLLRKLGRNAVFHISLDGEETQVIIKNIDRSALKPEFYNVEMQALQAGQTVEVQVAINLVGGEEIAEGILSQTLNELDIETLPAEIPSEITVSVGHLTIGDSITVADLEIPEGVTVLSDAEETVATVSAPQEEEEVDPDAEVVEPEVIGEADKEEE